MIKEPKGKNKKNEKQGIQSILNPNYKTLEKVAKTIKNDFIKYNFRNKF